MSTQHDAAARAREALDFCWKVGASGTVYLPTYAYLASAMGWPEDVAATAVSDLLASRALALVSDGHYALLSGFPRPEEAGA